MLPERTRSVVETPSVRRTMRSFPALRMWSYLPGRRGSISGDVRDAFRTYARILVRGGKSWLPHWEDGLATTYGHRMS